MTKSSEHNAENPKFIAYVHLLEAMCDINLLKMNPDKKSHVLVFKEHLDKDLYGKTEGWVSQNIFDVAQELMQAVQSGDTSLYDTLREEGYEPVFDESGEFTELAKIRCEKEME